MASASACPGPCGSPSPAVARSVSGPETLTTRGESGATTGRKLSARWGSLASRRASALPGGPVTPWRTALIGHTPASERAEGAAGFTTAQERRTSHTRRPAFPTGASERERRSSGESLVEDSRGLADHALDGMALDGALVRPASELEAACRRMDQLADARDERLDVLRRNEQAGPAERSGHVADRRRHARQAGHHRLEQCERQTLSARRKAEGVDIGEKCRNVVHKAGERDRQAPRLTLEPLAIRALADNDRLELIGLAEATHRLDEQVKTFLVCQPAHRPDSKDIRLLTQRHGSTHLDSVWHDAHDRLQSSQICTKLP